MQQGQGGHIGGVGNLCHVDCAHRGICDYSTGVCSFIMALSGQLVRYGLSTREEEGGEQGEGDDLGKGGDLGSGVDRDLVFTYSSHWRVSASAERHHYLLLHHLHHHRVMIIELSSSDIIIIGRRPSSTLDTVRF